MDNFPINYESFLSDMMPGYISIKDTKSKYLFVNKQLAHLLGFKKQADIVGKTDYDLNCGAAKNAAAYIEQDRHVMANITEVQYISQDSYYQSQKKIILAYCKPYIDDRNHISGTITYGLVLDTNKTTDLILKLNQTCSSEEHTLYHIKADYHDFGLNKQESACLFYLLRGMSYKEIGKSMNRSPRTVENYMNDLKFKLDCPSRQILIEKCLALGLHLIVPSSIL